MWSGFAVVIGVRVCIGMEAVRPVVVPPAHFLHPPLECSSPGRIGVWGVNNPYTIFFIFVGFEALCSAKACVSLPSVIRDASVFANSQLPLQFQLRHCIPVTVIIHSRKPSKLGVGGFRRSEAFGKPIFKNMNISKADD